MEKADLVGRTFDGVDGRELLVIADPGGDLLTVKLIAGTIGDLIGVPWSITLCDLMSAWNLRLT